MGKNISIITSILIVFLINSTSVAQNDKEKGINEIAESQTKRMEAKLNLTEDQSIQVKKINLQFLHDLRTALQEEENEEIMIEARILRSIHERNNSLKEVLSEDQMSEVLLSQSGRLLARNRYK